MHILFSTYLHFNFGLECTIRKVQNNQKGMKVSVTLGLCTGVNWLGKSTVKRKMKAVLSASKEVGVEVNKEKTKYILMSHHQIAGQNHNMKISLNSRKQCNKSKLHPRRS
jgi:hypothetical protein